MNALELLKDMERNMEGVGTISVPYHINQIKESIVELEQLRPRPLLFGNLLGFRIVVSNQVPNDEIWFATNEQLAKALEYSANQIRNALKASERKG